jgi:hypothetical protein
MERVRLIELTFERHYTAAVNTYLRPSHLTKRMKT